MNPSDVANDAIQAYNKKQLPKWYDINANQAKRVWEILRREGFNRLGTAKDPDGGYWVYEYEER